MKANIFKNVGAAVVLLGGAADLYLNRPRTSIGERLVKAVLAAATAIFTTKIPAAAAAATSRRRRTSGMAAVTGLATAMVMTAHAAPAAAFPISGVVQVAYTTANDTDPSKVAPVDCPTGKVVIGTGWRIYPEQREVVIEDVIPYRDSVLAVAKADETGASNWSLTVFATCASEPAGYQIVTGPSLSSSGDKTPIAFCPDPKVTIGVGFAMAGASGQMVLTSLNPEPDFVSMTAYEDDTGTGVTWNANAYAICAYEPDGWEIVSHTQNQTGTGQWSVQDFTECPVGKKVIGAGAYLDEGEGNVYISSLRLNFYGGGEYAQVAAYEDEDGTADVWDVTTDAICVNK